MFCLKKKAVFGEVPDQILPPVTENINNNEYLPGCYKDLTSLKHTVLQIHALNHESLDFFIGFHL